MQLSKKSYKRKTILSIICVFALIISMFYGITQNINAGGLLQKVDKWSSLFPSEYGWSYKFIPGVTTVSYGGFTNDKTLGWHGNYDDKQSGVFGSDDYNSMIYINLLTSTKGSPWVRYNNVGMYKGNIVDIKFTVTDWQTYQSSNQTSNKDYPTIAFRTTNIAVNQTNYSRYNCYYKVELMYHNTNTLLPSDMKYHFTSIDMDGGAPYGTNNEDGTVRASRESITISSNSFDHAYAVNTNNAITSSYSGNNITFKNTSNNSTSDNDPNGHITFLMSGPTFTYTYNTDLKGAGYNKRSFFAHAFTGISVAKFNSPQIYKSVSKNQITTNDTFNYYLDFTIPMESEEFKYSTLSASDTLNKYLDVNGNINIIDDSNINRNSDFNITNSNNKITITAKSPKNDNLYGKSYKITIPVKIKDAYKNSSFSDITSSSGTIISNKATLTTRDTTTSNTVTTEILFNIQTSVTNGTITNSISSIKGGSSKNISFSPNEGYVLSKITVDGTNVNIDNYNDNDSYTFSNINSNHTIHVEYIPSAPVNVEVVKEYRNSSGTVLSLDDLSSHYKISKNMTSSKFNMTGNGKNYKVSYQFGDTIQLNSIKTRGSHSIIDIQPSETFHFLRFENVKNDSGLTLNTTNNTITIDGASRNPRTIKIKSIIQVEDSVMNDLEDKSNLFKVN